MTDNGTAGGAVLRHPDRKNNRNGWAHSGYNAGLRGNKGTAYEGGHRAACFLHWPEGRLSGGRDIDKLTSHIDLLPTLAELCGLKPDMLFDGRSLKPLFAQPPGDWPERTLVVHDQSRFGQPMEEGRPIKYKEFAVMTDRWRLVGDELYEIRTDPGQRTDVAASYPDEVRALKAVYETWWADVTEKAAEFSRPIVGSPEQGTVVLTSQQWHGDLPLYSQNHVRAGIEANGFWPIEVAVEGVYEITLRRWPVEIDLPFDAVMPDPPVDPEKYDTTSKLRNLKTVRLSPVSAMMEIGEKKETRAIEPGDKAVSFRVRLKAGPVELYTELEDETGRTWGAYYVYVRVEKHAGYSSP
ncbi:MAG: N-acetylgalactosamine-4-sulfatase, partial [Verrucomicrobiota bacterium]